MTVARRLQVSLAHTPYYHCTTRCVRRAFLCGRDRHTGRNFDHRKAWLEQRLRKLADVFAIHLLAYAIMDNHYHVVVQIDENQSRRWSDEEVTKRWGCLFAVPDVPSDDRISVWRRRLADLSWYMRCLNEPLARTANREDGCTGRFWEARFRCQALLDEAALLKCMAYVDLNPIRAGAAKTPEQSCHTSVQARIRRADEHLLPFAEPAKRGKPTVPFRQTDYLSLVDWTGRALRIGTGRRIPPHLPPILERIAMPGDDWMLEIRNYGRWYYRAVGSLQTLEAFCQHLGQRWLKGQARTFAVANLPF